MKFLYYLFLLILKYLFNYDPESKIIHSSTTTILSSIVPTSTSPPNCFFTPSNTTFMNCPYGKSGPYCDECGLRFFTPNVKIVGGQEAAPGSWPSMAFILFSYKFKIKFNNSEKITTYQSFCGGSLIDRSNVLTAAHCYKTQVEYQHNGQVYSYKVQINEYHPTIESMYTVYLGLHNNAAVFEENGDISPGVALPIRKFIYHPEYDANEMNDIAIVQLAKEAPLKCNIQPACLPNANCGNYPTSVNISAWSAGWGTLKSDGDIPDNLYNVKMTLYDGNSMCADVSGPKNWDIQICAGAYEGGIDTCQGDSGGPLFILDNVNNKRKYIIIGVVSYGDGCGEPGYPGIYTKVSPYLSWIKDVKI